MIQMSDTDPGSKFGRWTVLAEAERTRWGMRRFSCLCDCGNKGIVCVSALRAGKSRSCGCLKNELHITRATVHGESRRGNWSAEYKAWAAMNSRCYDKNGKAYRNYGGRGIITCSRWRFGENGKSGFECFLADVGRRPSGKHSLDRFPDNDGPYAPGNVRWATRAEQNTNTRRAYKIVIGGNPMCLIEAARLYKTNYGTVKSRLQRGLPIERALHSALCTKAEWIVRT